MFGGDLRLVCGVGHYRADSAVAMAAHHHRDPSRILALHRDGILQHGPDSSAAARLVCGRGSRRSFPVERPVDVRAAVGGGVRAAYGHDRFRGQLLA